MADKKKTKRQKLTGTLCGLPVYVNDDLLPAQEVYILASPEEVMAESANLDKEAGGEQEGG